MQGLRYLAEGSIHANEMITGVHNLELCELIMSTINDVRSIDSQREQDQLHRATTASRESLGNFEARYEGGLELYSDVVTSKTAALANQRNDIELMHRQLDASVLLIKALGGGWNTQQLLKL
jgi:outer membrane protein TolC